MVAAAARPRDILDLLIQEHREAEALLDLVRLAEDATGRRHSADQVIAHLVRHCVIEEYYVYPIVRGYLVDGEELVAHHEAEHAQLERLLRDLEQGDGGGERFMDVVLDLQAELSDHIADEEAQLFATLRFAVPADDLVRLRASVALSGRISPQGAPGTPPHDLLLGMVLPGEGLVDRLRDALLRA